MHLSELLEAQRTQFGNWFTLWRKEAWRIEKDSFSGYVTRKPTCQYNYALNLEKGPELSTGWGTLIVGLVMCNFMTFRRYI